MDITVPKEIETLQSELKSLFDGNKRRALSRRGGVYCFWWKEEGNEHKLPENTCALFQGASIGVKKIANVKKYGVPHVERGTKYYREVCGPLKGKLPVPCPLEGYACLYVGKTAKDGGITSRVGQHVCSGTLTRSKYLYYRPKEKLSFKQHSYDQPGPDYIKKKGTVSQFRAGLEYLFRMEAEGFAYARMKDSVYVSWVDDEALTFRDRFYLEDLAIGLFHPWFNLDSER
jgi:hypothetical protein